MVLIKQILSQEKDESDFEDKIDEIDKKNT